jgi:hypothetical protein
MDRRTVGLVQNTRLAQMPLTAPSLACEQMAQVGALMLDLAGLAEGEALGGAARRLNLRHIPTTSFSDF